MQYLKHTFAQESLVYLKYRFSWASCILFNKSGNLKGTPILHALGAECSTTGPNLYHLVGPYV